jgi:hypothetical protein
MLRFIFSWVFFLVPVVLFAQDLEDDTVVVKKFNSGHQFRIGFDASKILFNSLATNKITYELSLDYYLNKEVYGVTEFGWGSSNIDYTDLKYQTNNSFFRFGIDKSLFVRKSAQDWGLGFFGLRYGLGFINRKEAQYQTNDGLGGVTFGLIPSDNFMAHWVELTGGMKIELLKGFFAGWTVRTKFLLNQKSLGDLKPAHIAGYGAGEKVTAFDFNFYLSYALRWSKR